MIYRLHPRRWRLVGGSWRLLRFPSQRCALVTCAVAGSGVLPGALDGRHRVTHEPPISPRVCSVLVLPQWAPRQACLSCFLEEPYVAQNQAIEVISPLSLKNTHSHSFSEGQPAAECSRSDDDNVFALLKLGSPHICYLCCWFTW